MAAEELLPAHEIQKDYTSGTAHFAHALIEEIKLIDGFHFIKPRFPSTNNMDLLRSVIGSSVASIGRAATHLAHIRPETEDLSWPNFETHYTEYKGHRDPYIVIEPSQEHKIDSSEIQTDVFLMGLSEMVEFGTGRNLIREHAMLNPGNRTIGLSTPGMSGTGDLLKFLDAFRKNLDDISDQHLQTLSSFKKEGPIVIHATSLGSPIAFIMIDKNINANVFKKLTIPKLKTISSAVGHRQVCDNEKFSDNSVEDKEYVEDLTWRFFEHMLYNSILNATKDPNAVAKSMDILLTFMLEPHKSLHRVATAIGNIRAVQAGVDWESLKNVYRNTKVYELNGETDPLTPEQIPQRKVLAKHANEDPVFWIILGQGHAMSLHSNMIAQYLKAMEHVKVVS